MIAALDRLLEDITVLVSRIRPILGQYYGDSRYDDVSPSRQQPSGGW